MQPAQGGPTCCAKLLIDSVACCNDDVANSIPTPLTPSSVGGLGQDATRSLRAPSADESDDSSFSKTAARIDSLHCN